MIELDPLLLARIQFAFTVSFHIIFPAFTIGLSSFLATLEFRWLTSGDDNYKHLYQFWIKIFAVTFGMGVVSGVVMSYEFGTNWSIFSDKIANVLGPLLGYEVLTAFFLEASFLGIMLFGWGRVSKKMHFASTLIVAIGTLISAFWILSANSFMQTPQGYEIASDGRLMPLNWVQIIFNPSFHFRYAHMVTGAYLTTALVVGGVGAFYLFKKRHVPEAKIMLAMATLIVSIFAPLQLVIGDSQGLNSFEYQPSKIAAMEGIWDNEKGAALRIFAIPNESEEKNNYEIKIPYLSSLILTHSMNGEVKGLKSFPKEDRPPVMIVFFAFRIMVGLGVLMIVLGLFSAIQYARKRLYNSRLIQYYWMLMMPAGFLSILSGWFVTEVGRQPYTVYGVIRTVTSVSPAITAPQVAYSLLAFVILYTCVFGAGSYYILKLIGKGIKAKDDSEQYYKHGIEGSVIEATTIKGDKHV
jgi:cytochrome d ubiquinol oxidase subunit I